jgi:hypothetical protein
MRQQPFRPWTRFTVMKAARTRLVVALAALVCAFAAPALAGPPPVCLPPLEPAWGSGQMCTPSSP